MIKGAEQGGIDPRIGTVAAGKYRILAQLGRGGMGTVYEAQNISIGKRVALKFVLLGQAADPAVRARFHQEARAVSAIESAHIVQIFDTGETDGGEPFIVMELLQGEDLATLLRRRGRLPPVEAVHVVVQALRGLRRAHAAGIIHRDLKPGNLFLVPGEDDRTHVKIVDFGLSKDLGGITGVSGGRLVFSERAAITAEGAMVGTPLYMSPEQIEALPDVDHRTDIWSMGAILHEVLTGAPPFAETSYARLLIAICQRDPEDVRRLAPGVPEGVARAVSQALCRDRSKRLSSADEFLRVLLAAVPELDSSLASRVAAETPVPEAQAAVPSAKPRPSIPADSAKPGPGPHEGSSPDAELRTYTLGGATLWISQSPAFSLWRGEVAAPDRLRVESRDGGLHELRLSPVGELRLGRAERVGEERNELVYADVASRLAAILRHDGVRWWLRRRVECSVPVQVGARALGRGEEAPLVHGTFVSVGGMRATMVDRRYVTPTVPAGTVDPLTGLLGRAGLEQEVAAFLQRKRPGALVLARALGSTAAAAEYPPVTFGVIGIHRSWPSLVVGCVDGTAVLLAPGNDSEVAAMAHRAAEVARGAGAVPFACGSWLLAGEGLDAGREIELALHAIKAHAESPSVQASIGAGGPAIVSLREIVSGARFATMPEVLAASGEARRATLLFGIEEQNALGGVGPHVVAALEQELAAVVATHAGSGALVAPLAPGVVAACITRKLEPTVLGNAVQCDWHARAPIMDGKVELPRTLSWEILHGAEAGTRAAEISRECSDPHGVLSALSGGLPYPIAGRVHAAIAASSAIERVKMLFDVLEGTWRFIATVLVSAYFAKRVTPAPEGSVATRPGTAPTSPADAVPGFAQMVDFYRRAGSRDGFALGTWRELARLAAKGFEDRGDPIGALAKDVLGVKLSQNQTFETLSNLMQVERNSFAHGHYNEARGAADLPEFEQMTRAFLRALRPLCSWTLVTVEKTEPDLYGEVQTVEFIDHTGPFNTGTRRRIGLNSPVRLANVAYLARWREGLVLPLDPLIRRVAHDDKFDLFWMDHLPRAGICHMSSAVGGPTLKVPCDVRRLPPLLRMLVEKGSS